MRGGDGASAAVNTRLSARCTRPEAVERNQMAMIGPLPVFPHMGAAGVWAAVRPRAERPALA